MGKFALEKALAVVPDFTPYNPCSALHTISLLLRGVHMTTEPSDDKHSFRFKWGSLEVAAIGWPAVITVLLSIMALVGLRLGGFI